MALFDRNRGDRKSLDDLSGHAAIDTAIDRITGGTLAYCHNGGNGGPKFEAGPIDWNPAVNAPSMNLAMQNGSLRGL